MNYKIIIQYDGTNYHGWQIQANAVSIQGIITEALEQLLKHKVTLTGSGRTDTGVHAINQVGNFITGSDLDFRKFLYSLNCILPIDISVKSIEHCSLDFNARHSARQRSYLYFISKKKSPFFSKYSFLQTRDINLDYLNEISQLLLGRYEFDSFAKHVADLENTNCEIFDARWRKSGELYIFKITASRFLHGMVRAITGTLLTLENRQAPVTRIKEIILAKDRTISPFSVPPKGLFLFKVRY